MSLSDQEENLVVDLIESSDDEEEPMDEPQETEVDFVNPHLRPVRINEIDDLVRAVNLLWYFNLNLWRIFLNSQDRLKVSHFFFLLRFASIDIFEMVIFRMHSIAVYVTPCSLLEALPLYAAWDTMFVNFVSQTIEKPSSKSGHSVPLVEILTIQCR